MFSYLIIFLCNMKKKKKELTTINKSVEMEGKQKSDKDWQDNPSLQVIR